MLNRRKLGLLLLTALLLWTACAAAAGLTLYAPGETIHPGKAVLIAYETEAAGTANLRLINAAGETVSLVAEDSPAQAGYNAFYWNGTYRGKLAPSGDWLLELSVDGETASEPVRIGEPAPYFLSLAANDGSFTNLRALTVNFNASRDATLRVCLVDGEERKLLAETPVQAGENTWKLTDAAAAAALTAGDYTLSFVLTDADGVSSTEEHLSVEIIPEPEVIYTPSYGSPYPAREGETGYWTLPMDITDEAAVWEMLMAPVTVVDTGKKNAQKSQVMIREEPDDNAAGVGVVTCVSQSVRVIERGDEWSLIETYSSSFHDSKVKAWNMLVQGYVKTKYLKTVKPNESMGIVIDKLTQRLYIFKDGKLYDTLLVSTGLANAKQPYNETRSGEFFLLVPAVGEFRSDNIYCSMGIRFNDGDLLHEVPHTKTKDGGKDFKKNEPKLGTRASHGCIRVQRLRTPLGTNMTWIWNNKKNNIKMVIWEDWQGRQYPYPADDLPLYYNPKGGTSYHTADHCYSVKNNGVTLEPFTYAELDSEPYAALERCAYCTAPLRKAEIDAINVNYLPGGDHDPIMTEAQQKYLSGK